MTLNEKYLNDIHCGEALIILSKLADNSIDCVLTDPPYFLDKLDNIWNNTIVNSKKNQQIVTSLPSGMKFDKKKGVEFYNWYYKISLELYRVVKNGGFFFSFSSPRLYHRMATAVDDAGFEIRDMFAWLYTQNQAKAMSLNHIINKNNNIPNEDKEQLKLKLSGWKTPQIKSCFEPIVMGQKTVEDSYLNNIMTHNVGLLNTNLTIGLNNMYPANVFSTNNINEYIDNAFLLPKPTKKEKGIYNTHKTVKPISICDYLIQLTAFNKDAVILDPFAGSGTTIISAISHNLNYIGIEINQEHVDIAKKRIDDFIHPISQELCF